MKVKEMTIPTPEGDITLSTGKMALLSPGAVFLTKGGTTIFASATTDSRESDRDFLPLTVEYLEKMYANGVISGSRVNKREGFPSEKAIIAARQVDHTIRPLFPKDYTRATNMIVTVMTEDGVNNPEELAVLGSSIAMMMSGIPFDGPVSSVIIVVDPQGGLHVNPPKNADHSDFLGEFVVSGGHGRVLNIEGWGKELAEEKMDEILDLAMQRITELNKAQLEFVKDITLPTVEYVPFKVEEDKVEIVKKAIEGKLESVLYNPDKPSRDADVNALTAETIKTLVEDAGDDAEVTAQDVSMAIDKLSQKIMRQNILDSEKRFSGRTLDEVRKLTAEVDLLPSVHGTALFSRGLTQSLSITTLAALARGNVLNDLTGRDDIEPFMHHYSFPPYSVGEAGRVSYKPGRREIGHGAIGYNAIKHLLPSEDDFPYSMRVVSEIMTSNGSTSMAATCAASMSLMAAGVPLKKAVGGIGVGLITGDDAQDQYKLLLDIEGVEDFFGDMDFKVTGTDEGITAIQFETKLKGVKPEILKEAFRLSRKGRMQVLDVMNAAISEPRAEMAPNAPKVHRMTINPEFIGAIIGPGGKHIKETIEQGNKLGTGPMEIDLHDDGTVIITASNKDQMDYGIKVISDIATEPEVGDIFDGVVESVMPYGAFVALGGGHSGLVHVSEMSNEFVKDPTTIVKQGDKVKVRMIGAERGKISLSMKQVEE